MRLKMGSTSVGVNVCCGVKEAIAAEGLDSDAEPADPEETGDAREALLGGLSSVCDLVGSVLDHPDQEKFQRDVIHYLNNALGMTSAEEAALYLRLGVTCRIDLFMRQGVSFTDAQQQVEAHVARMLHSLSNRDNNPPSS
jgi:hypothetical protein